MPAEHVLRGSKLALHEVPRFSLTLARLVGPKSGWSEPLLLSLPQIQTDSTLFQNTKTRGIGWIRDVGKYGGFISLISRKHKLLFRTRGGKALKVIYKYI